MHYLSLRVPVWNRGPISGSDTFVESRSVMRGYHVKVFGYLHWMSNSLLLKTVEIQRIGTLSRYTTCTKGWLKIIQITVWRYTHVFRTKKFYKINGLMALKLQ
jgi:hypothetical protein